MSPRFREVSMLVPLGEHALKADETDDGVRQDRNGDCQNGQNGPTATEHSCHPTRHDEIDHQTGSDEDRKRIPIVDEQVANADGEHGTRRKLCSKVVQFVFCVSARSSKATTRQSRN